MPLISIDKIPKDGSFVGEHFEEKGGLKHMAAVSLRT